MTHTLHRRGDVKDLHEDFVMLIMPARGFNLQGSEEKMRQIWEVLSHYEAKLTNFGNAEVGNSHRTTMQKLKEGNHRINHAVFKDRETVKACLKELKERDFGISVVISGLYEETEQICAEVGLKPHTVEHSLGIHGKTEALPDENTLEITTMCGHAMVSPNLVLHMVDELRAGNITYGEA
ncbi:MAG: hypothetical protein MUO52_11560, partial [Desulfobacterales bacterium]|nr:hypothetical protein [Desulfobacterales bacterium]